MILKTSSCIIHLQSFFLKWKKDFVSNDFLQTTLQNNSIVSFNQKNCYNENYWIKNFLPIQYSISKSIEN